MENRPKRPNYLRNQPHFKPGNKAHAGHRGKKFGVDMARNAMQKALMHTVGKDYRKIDIVAEMLVDRVIAGQLDPQAVMTIAEVQNPAVSVLALTLQRQHRDRLEQELKSLRVSVDLCMSRVHMFSKRLVWLESIVKSKPKYWRNIRTGS